MYALDTLIESKESLTKDDLLKKMKGHILAETVLTGIFRNY
ncbi:hypothetical protein [Pedobacter sp. SYSU D00535]